MADKSIVIQKERKILEDIIEDIVNEENNPLLKSICKKLSEIEKEGNAENENTIKLYGDLSEDEKKYLKDNDCLQSGYNGDFAVKFPCYRSLKNHGSMT